jgi:hypothetical protein
MSYMFATNQVIKTKQYLKVISIMQPAFHAHPKVCNRLIFQELFKTIQEIEVKKERRSRWAVDFSLFFWAI